MRALASAGKNILLVAVGAPLLSLPAVYYVIQFSLRVRFKPLRIVDWKVQPFEASRHGCRIHLDVLRTCLKNLQINICRLQQHLMLCKLLQAVP